MKHTIPEELRGVLLFVGAIWGVFFLSYVLPGNIQEFGVTPRSARGLIGILAMPFLHADLRHLVSNTIPLIVLLTLLAGSQARSWESVIEIVLLGGVILWVFGRNATHVGASGLIFGLIAFLLVSGIREGRIVALMIAVIVGFLYGGTLLGGVVPHLRSKVSWDGHLSGAIAGGIIGWYGTRHRREQEEQ